MLCKGTDEKRVMHSKIVKIQIMIGKEADEVIKDIFQQLLSRYQIDLEEFFKGCNVVFDFVNLLNYKCHKTSSNRGGSYIDSPNCKKTKTLQ